MKVPQIITAYKNVALLAVVALALLGANYSFAAWSNPPSSPPNGNVAVPVNVSTTGQAKDGWLGVRSLAVISPYPQFEFSDTNGKGSRIVGNAGRMDFVANNGTAGSPSWSTSLILNSASAPGGKYARFYSDVRATRYCDQNGNNCLIPGATAPTAPTAPTAAETDPQVGGLIAGQWCRSKNDGTKVICTEDKPLQNCRSRSVTRDNSTYSRTTAFCNADETLTGGSCNTNGFYHPPNYPINPSDSNFPNSGPNRMGWHCATSASDSGHTSVHVICCK
jgi:hypothetical protein